MSEKVRISYNDLQSPRVDEILKRQNEEAALRSGAGAASEELSKVSLIHKSWFNLMIAGLLGALLAWALVEPFIKDTRIDTGSNNSLLLLMLLSVGGMVGLMIGSMEGILARNLSRALKAGSVGLGIGIGGALISLVVIGLLAMVIIPIGVEIVGRHAAEDPQHHFSGFMLIVIVRTLLWTVLGMSVGLGPGIGLKSKKLVFNGFIGGMIGGAIGGLLFDPINYLVSGGTMDSHAEVSRAIGFCVVGSCAGLLIGLVETLTKDAWLLMTAGPLKGKQFIIYKNPTIIGSSPKCEIYLFKDSSIEPFHAAINILRDGYEIEDRNTSSGTLVNGHVIRKYKLRSGDTIQIGETRFIYSEKEKKSSNQ